MSAARSALLLAVAALVVAALAVGARPAPACACGGVFSQSSDAAAVPQEVALIRLAAGRETITMQLRVESDAEDAGLVIPTPGAATAKLGDKRIFDALTDATRPLVKTRTHLFGSTEDGGAGGAAPPSGPKPAGGVQVLGSVDLGPIRATTLAAGDGDGLRRWLGDHGYKVRREVQNELDIYASFKWYFVAIKVTPAGRELRGDLPPIELAFDSDRLIYPMRMSRAAQSPTLVRTYVLSQHKVARDDATAERTPVSTIFAGRLDPEKVSEPLRAALAGTPYLTAVQQAFSQPSAEVESDFTFLRAPDDKPYRQVIWRDRYIFQPDTAVPLALLAALVVAGAAGLVFWRRRLAR